MRASSLVHAFLLWTLCAAVATGTRADASAAGASPSSLANAAAEPEPSDPPGYRAAVEHALAELGRGHFSEARAMFLRAHEIYPNARTLRGLALAEFELRSYPESIEHFQAALAHPVRPLDDKLRTQAEELMTRARGYVTQLELRIKPVQAITKLDGALIDARGRALLLNEGEHMLEVEAQGYRPESRKIRALGGDTQRLALALVPEPALDKAAHDEAARPLYKNPWLWTGVGILVVGAAVTASLLATRDDGPNEDPYPGTAGVSIRGL